MNTIEGTFRQALPVQEGTSARGPWMKGGLVVEYADGQYMRNAALIAFGAERVGIISSLQPGDKVSVDFAIESREYNGRWYTDLNAIRIIPAEQAVGRQQKEAPVQQQAQYATAPEPQSVTAQAINEEKQEDDLPF